MREETYILFGELTLSKNLVIANYFPVENNWKIFRKNISSFRNI